MSAPDVERLVVEISNRVYEDDFDWSDQTGSVLELSRANLEMIVRETALAALSSRPDSIPKDEIPAGERLAHALDKILREGANALTTAIGLRAIEAYRAKQCSLPPPQDDVAGRLADLERELKEVYNATLVDADEISERMARDIVRVLHSSADRALSKIAAYRANPSGWITVGERLPRAGTKAVIAWDSVDHSETIIRRMNLAQFLRSRPRFTHWQPLPTPPQEGQTASPAEAQAEQREGEKV